MTARRFFTVAFLLAATLASGCISPFKTTPVATTAAKPDAKAPEAEPDGIGDPRNPLPRIKAFVNGEGLASAPAKPGEESRLVAAWDNKICYAPDTTRGGDPVPGLVVRLWVFGPELGKPLVADGELIAGVWDQTPKESGGQPALIEVWHIDRTTAAKFRRDDLWGSGYSLFLPWQRYSVDIKQVNVQIRFNGADGRSLVAPTQILTLDHSQTLQRAAEKLGLRSDGTKEGAAPGKLPELPIPGTRPWPEPNSHQ